MGVRFVKLSVVGCQLSERMKVREQGTFGTTGARALTRIFEDTCLSTSSYFTTIFTSLPLTTSTFITSLPSVAALTFSLARAGAYGFLVGVGGDGDAGLDLAVDLNRDLDRFFLRQFRVVLRPGSAQEFAGLADHLPQFVRGKAQTERASAPDRVARQPSARAVRRTRLFGRHLRRHRAR